MAAPILSLAALRHGFNDALLAASCAVAIGACRSREPELRPEASAALPSATGTTASTNASTPPPSSSAEAGAPPSGCAFGPLQVTGCGGAEVAITSSLASCSLPETGNLDASQCAVFCKGFASRGCHVFKNRDQKSAVFCNAAHPCLGRRPARGRAPRVGGAALSFDAFLREAERTEARSVDAFLEIESDLAAFGAPKALLQGCRRAARDEARHAVAMRGLRGGVARPKLRGRRRKGFASLEALALHNEREGVVSETWAALLAAHQAANAVDPEVRRVFETVAEEELAHAALALRIAGWARAALGPRGTAKLDRARNRALARLTRPLPTVEENAGRALGWPSREVDAILRARLTSLLAAA